ncbi:39S ribosomal protein L30, mitochondrial isoform X1 [Pipra filicauda]|uniref:Large ribosomal subunit protein uL30m n=1 Tax=Pipra filicauda TaxID=649802 RepID=A0A6J2GF28_9PASS|nr:39S ribosomal protein L30, mitochondrial isoform X1 [Pipra filicauda]
MERGGVSPLSFRPLGTQVPRRWCPAERGLLGKRMEGMVSPAWARCLFTRSRIPDSVFQPRPGDHEKYGGDPEQPHKIHVITRIKSVIGRPYWEKKIVRDLGLDKAHQPRLHKNIPSVNSKLKVIKHLIRIKPLKLPYGLPTEEEIPGTFLTRNGELVIKRRLKPVEQKEIES